MLNDIIEKDLIEARGIIGFWPANQVDHEDIEVYTDTSKSNVLCKLHTLRQQLDKDQDHFLAMGDFIAPKESGVTDYIGMFAVSAGFKQDDLCKKFEADHDDYNYILVKSLTDRLAEAFAEQMHHEVRKQYWGYSPEETLDVKQILAVKYQGIRPAPGYPSQPDHTEKETMWNVMKVKEETGIELTESLAMLPASSTCGLYFGNKCASYFSVDEIQLDQVESYAKRKGMKLETAEKWLAPILGYEK